MAIHRKSCEKQEVLKESAWGVVQQADYIHLPKESRLMEGTAILRLRGTESRSRLAALMKTNDLDHSQTQQLPEALSLKQR
ncbi:hypothetical protein NQZ68_014101 [Dissostichus eleginoides]|nr:hypothetical protein NQZ68_014101 [Dissostichus eleginoides]